MPTPEELKIAEETLETKRQIEEIVGSPVGTLKTDLKLTDEECGQAYAEMLEGNKQILKTAKKYRPLTLAVGLFLIVVGIGFIVLNYCAHFNDDAFIILAVIIIILGVGSLILCSPILYQRWVQNPISKEEYFNWRFVKNAKDWLKEAKKNNYYLDLQEKALVEKYEHKISVKGPQWHLLVGDTEFNVLRCKDGEFIMSSITFQTEKISGITVQKRVQEKVKSVSTENKFYNQYVGSKIGNRFTTETEVTRITDYVISLSFSNRVNPYSFYIGTDTNLLLSMVNLFERLTGLQAIRR